MRTVGTDFATCTSSRLRGVEFGSVSTRRPKRRGCGTELSILNAELAPFQLLFGKLLSYFNCCDQVLDKKAA